MALAEECSELSGQLNDKDAEISKLNDSAASLTSALESEKEWSSELQSMCAKYNMETVNLKRRMEVLGGELSMQKSELRRREVGTLEENGKYLFTPGFRKTCLKLWQRTSG